MEIIPSIYILDGMCVALYKGSFSQKATYFKSPLQMAVNFEKEGAEKLHLVDLKGQMEKNFEQRKIIGKIISAVKIPAQLEAGFSTLEEIREAFELGASQAVIRSPAPEFIKSAIDEFGPEKIIVELVSKGGEIVNGGKKRPEEIIDVVDYAESLVPLRVKYIIYKDQRSEGTLIHPNYDEVDRLYLTTGKDLKIYVSGGISEVRHLKLLKTIGASGAIIGKAFYEKILTVRQAKEAVRE